MDKNEIETNIEALLVRLCAGVIAHRPDLELRKTFTGTRLTKYNLRCHAADCPRIIGKSGLRFRALRTLVETAGAKMGRQMELETMEKPIKGEPAPFPKFKYNQHWPKAEVQKLLDDTCTAVFKFPCSVVLREAVGAAVFIVQHDEREPLSLADNLAPALQAIFSGIGTTNGCQLSVDVSPKPKHALETQKAG